MKNGDICALCASQRRLFEPTVLNCSGSCGTTKIRRNSYYYTDPSKSNFWCVSCFTALKDDETVILDDGSNVLKYHLQRLKNDATPEEAWVQCDTCSSWVHQICALFNGRKNKSAASYSCPKCHVKKAAAGELKKPEVLMKGASQLPHSKMSQTIEQGLNDALEKAYKEKALELCVPYAEVEKAEGLSVRVISNMEQKHLVRDEMFERYTKRGCPQEFPVRSKCVALFQNIHGVDVILFGMYVFEYNHECPAPNRRRVYISYIDSVNYFRPKTYRTLTYQTIIVEYLRYVKERGFHTAHIWSCPPSPGDDYIFHIHPTQQRIPKDNMLCQWYHDVLEKAKSDGVVLEVRSLYDEYFKNNGEDSITGNASDPTCLPYFEGDYIPGEIENIIKDVKTDEEAKRKTNPNWEEERPSSSSNRTGKKTGTRSNPGSLVNIRQDKVMLRLGLAVSNMKQNFFVARLRSREFATAVERGDDVSEWKEDDDGSLTNKRPKIGGKASGGFSVSRPDPSSQTKIVNTPSPSAVDISSVTTKGGPSEPTEKRRDDDDCSLGTVSVSLGQSNNEVLDAFGDSKSSFDGDKAPSDSSKHGLGDASTIDTSDNASVKGDWDDPIVKGKSDDAVDMSGGPGDHKGKEMAAGEKDESSKTIEPSSASKRGFDEMGPAIARHFAAMNAMKKPVADTKDEDPPQELELFESRQQFLSYCQKNHFQFDELRRAKHTTMMVLYQLHNPNAPKFLQQCGACLREITQGVRYHCNTCSNFDLCVDCYGPVMKGEWTQRDKRLAHDPTHAFFRVKVDANEKGNKKNTAERAKAIKAHLELLSHAASCDGPPSCALNNCQRMKKLFEHVKICDISPKKSCKVCSRLLTLLTMHSRLCTVRGRCPLPFCDRIRERNRRRKRQQQLMDDRRRQAQNQLYRQSEQHA
uniref:histone acetyltransferase n=1 Tax=Grammatophora oceanica TaxID=210454 RepID=A0A7S1UT71_9STRA|mmetsp:Transcript_21323/g.31675  ORF Transcript_21323/g.31675 Transcript_21323/m.31675 type:complete len:920 (+) Transcript_21323:1477-4236(+)